MSLYKQLLVLAFTLVAGLQATQPIILIGPPLSGKGTLAKTLAADLHIPHISAGDLLRAEIEKKSDLGLRVKDIVASGGLTPDNWVSDLVVKRLAQADCKHGYILDGFPRRVGQAEALEAFLGPNQKVTIIQLEAPESTLIARATDRSACSDCGASYSKSARPSKVAGECDDCHAPLTVRKDDLPETVRHRLELYTTETKPVLDFYRDRRPVQVVDGTQTPDEVLKTALRILKENAA